MEGEGIGIQRVEVGYRRIKGVKRGGGLIQGLERDGSRIQGLVVRLDGEHL